MEHFCLSGRAVPSRTGTHLVQRVFRSLTVAGHAYATRGVHEVRYTRLHLWPMNASTQTARRDMQNTLENIPKQCRRTVVLPVAATIALPLGPGLSRRAAWYHTIPTIIAITLRLVRRIRNLRTQTSPRDPENPSARTVEKPSYCTHSHKMHPALLGLSQENVKSPCRVNRRVVLY